VLTSEERAKQIAKSVTLDDRVSDEDENSNHMDIMKSKTGMIQMTKIPRN
jgi:hypothetical protein